MGTVVVHRAKPFQRGDLSISVYVDGKASGTLLSNNELSISLPAGQHELTAYSNGGHGKKYPVNIGDGEQLHLQVHPPIVKTYWWEAIFLFPAFSLPDKLFGKNGWWLQLVFWIVFLAIGLTIQIAIRRPQMRNWLRIEPLQETAIGMQLAKG
jgi:hypothetical protein